MDNVGNLSQTTDFQTGMSLFEYSPLFVSNKYFSKILISYLTVFNSFSNTSAKRCTDLLSVSA